MYFLTLYKSSEITSKTSLLVKVFRLFFLIYKFKLTLSKSKNFIVSTSGHFPNCRTCPLLTLDTKTTAKATYKILSDISDSILCHLYEIVISNQFRRVLSLSENIYSKIKMSWVTVIALLIF